MNADTWQKLRNLHDQALLLSGDDRWELANRQTNPEIREELAKLIEAMDASGDFLEDPYRARPDSAKLPRFGNYAGLRKLGQGGMGSVWLARRDDGEFDHTVAVKVIRGGGGPDLVRRFRQERQALAALNHPNIARLLDGGATEDGDPYLVMDYIDGEPLDAYAERRNLALHARLELVVQLCRALEYAHERRVLHCDIKPSNALVDARGHVYLLDFGLARYLEEANAADRTRTLLRAATPEYASPEALTGRAVTEASDVYSVGVVLYQLIAGKRPYQLDTKALVDLHRYFESRPVPRLPETSSRELQLVVYRALHTDPRRRYPGVASLRQDIERILSGRSVLARPDSMLYRIMRWTHARPWTGISASAALLAVVMLAAAVWVNPVAHEIFLSYVTPRPVYRVALAPIKDLSARAETAWLAPHLAAQFRNELEAGGVWKIDDVSGSLAQSASSAPLPSDALSRLRVSGATALLGGGYQAHDSDPLSTLRLNLWVLDTASGKRSDFTFSSSLAEADALVARACRTISERYGDESYPARASHGPGSRASDALTTSGIALLGRFDLMGARTALERAVNRNVANLTARAALAQTVEALGYNDDAHSQIAAAAALAGYGGSAARSETTAVAAELDEDWTTAIAIRRAQLAQQPGSNSRSLALGRDLLGGRQLDELSTLTQREIVRAADPVMRFNWVLLKGQMVHTARGRAAELAAADELEDAARGLNSPILRGEMLETLSDLYAGGGKRPVSIARLLEGRDEFAKAGHREGVARLTGLLTQRYQNTHRQEEAIQIASSALRDIDGAGFAEAEQFLRFHLGTAYLANHDPQTAQTYFIRGLAEKTRPFGLFDKRRLLERLGIALVYIGQTGEGIQRLESALGPTTDADAIIPLHYLIDAELSAGKLADAETHLARLASNRKNPVDEAKWIGLRRLEAGVLRGDIANLDVGFQAIVDARQENIAEPAAAMEEMWGRALLAINRPADAAVHFRQAVKGFEAREEPFEAAAPEIELAAALARSGKPAEAKRELARAADAPSSPYAERRADYAYAAAQIELASGPRKGLDALQAAAAAYRQAGLLPRALYAEMQLVKLRRDATAQARLAAEASAAGIVLYWPSSTKPSPPKS